MANFQKAYPQYSKGEIDSLLGETHDRGFIYDPYQAYREAPHSGRFVNVSADGYRRNATTQAGINDTGVRSVFIFGGSTTFGYGVADTNTIAACLDRRLKQKDNSYCVYNFGAGGYYSNQELIWFKRSIMDRKKPELIIFIDGPNEFNIKGDDPLFAGNIRRCLGNMELSKDIKDSRSFFDRYLSGLAAVRLYGRVLSAGTDASAHMADVNNAEISDLLSRYRANCKIENAIAEAYGIKTLFVVQPVPQYDYDLSYHIFHADPMLRDPYMSAAYEQMRKMHNESSLNRLWLGSMQHGLRENLYVDNVHYNPEMNRMVADSIFQAVNSIIPAHDTH